MNIKRTIRWIHKLTFFPSTEVKLHTHTHTGRVMWREILKM
jgi:hypothetical protein